MLTGVVRSGPAADAAQQAFHEESPTTISTAFSIDESCGTGPKEREATVQPIRLSTSLVIGKWRRQELADLR